MKKIFLKGVYKMLSLSLVAFMLFVSCNKDDNGGTSSDNYSEQESPDKESPDDGVSISVIAGMWKTEYTWPSGNVTTVIMEIMNDGSVSFVSTSKSDGGQSFGSGTCKYDKTMQRWIISTNDSFVSGNYLKVGNQLISVVYFESGSTRTVVYERYEEDSDKDSDDGNVNEDIDYTEVLSDVLSGEWYGMEMYDDNLLIEEIFTFDPSNKKGEILYVYNDLTHADDDSDGDGAYATGTYVLLKDRIEVSYSYVSVWRMTGENTFMGFTDGKSVKITYTIESWDGKYLTIKDKYKTYCIDKARDW